MKAIRPVCLSALALSIALSPAMAFASEDVAGDSGQVLSGGEVAYSEDETNVASGVNDANDAGNTSDANGTSDASSANGAGDSGSVLSDSVENGTPSLGASSDGAESANGVSYIDANGATQTFDGEVRMVSASDTEWSDGWYVSDGTTVIGSKASHQRITVTGDVKLILADNSNLTVWGGISVNEGSSLTIYAQTKYDENDPSNAGNATVGKLTATADVEGTRDDGVAGILDGYAGIGGDRRHSAGAITINGGVVEAVGQGYPENQYKNSDNTYGDYASHGAGIGGGAGGTGGHITINAGKVTATAMGYAGAGIGGGSSASAGDISINGGMVEARAYGVSSEGKGNGSGIGSGGYTSVKGDGAIDITGGTVTAYGSMYGASIGGGANDFGGSISITGGVVNCERESTRWNAPGLGAGGLLGGYQGVKGDIVIAGGKVRATGLGGYSAIGGNGAMGNLYISGSADVTAEATGSSGSAIRFPSGSVEISGGTVKATSANGAGICVNSGSSLLISGGTVTAEGGGSGAGIGSANWLLGTIEITGGDVKASSTNRSGIGNGSTNGANSGGGSIKISGGNVWAQGASLEWNSYPGIGGGGNSDGAAQPTSIEISGGVVVALGGTRTNTSTSANYASPGICGAYWKTATPGMANTIKISGGTVTSIGGSKTTADIGNTVDNDITITGGSVKVREKSGNIGGMKVTPKDADGNEVVLAMVPVASLVSSVSVDDKPYYVDSKHRKLSNTDPDDNYLYLYVTEDNHTLSVRNNDDSVSTYNLMWDAANSSFTVGAENKVDTSSRVASSVEIAQDEYAATYGQAAAVEIETAVSKKDSAATTDSASAVSVLSASAPLDAARITVSSGGKTYYDAREAVSFGADQAQGFAKFSVPVSDLPAGVYDVAISYGGSDDVTESSDKAQLTISKVDQVLSYATTSVSKRVGDAPFINELTKTTVFGDVSYESSDKAVATVDAAGEVTVVGEGKATITATAAAFADASGKYDAASASYELSVSRRSSGGGDVVVPVAHSISATKLGKGEVSLGSTHARKGETVTLLATPDEGFAVESISAVDASGNEVAVTDRGENSYSFTMPATEASVTVAFAKATPSVFGDVDSAQWYAPGVRFVDSRGIMNGYSDDNGNPTGVFGVGKVLTRAELAVLLFNYADEGVCDPDAENETGLLDVESGTWYTSAANWAVSKGVIQGTTHEDGTKTFDPYEPATLEQMITIIARFAGADVSAADALELSRYEDSSAVSDWAVQSVAWGSEVGLFSGYSESDGSYIRPTQSILRERVAAIIMNACMEGVLK